MTYNGVVWYSMVCQGRKGDLGEVSEIERVVRLARCRQQLQNDSGKDVDAALHDVVGHSNDTYSRGMSRLYSYYNV